MYRLIAVILAFVGVNLVYANELSKNDLCGGWYLKAIVIKQDTIIPPKAFVSYLYFKYDQSNSFYLDGGYKVVDGVGRFENTLHSNLYHLEEDTIDFIGPRKRVFRMAKNVTFDLANELFGAFQVGVDHDKLLLKKDKITLHYAKDSVVNCGLKKAANSPFLGFDQKLEGTWRLVKMDASKSLMQKVKQDFRDERERRLNYEISRKSFRKLMKNGKQEVDWLLENGGWFVSIGEFVDNTSRHDSTNYGNTIRFANGCNSCSGLINSNDSTLKIQSFVLCTMQSCFPDFTGRFKSSLAFDQAAYHFKGDTLIVQAPDRISYFIRSETESSKQTAKSKNLFKYYKMVDVDLENLEKQNKILSLMPSNEIYFYFSANGGRGLKNEDCFGRHLKIYLFNDENYYMYQLMIVVQEGIKEKEDEFRINCIDILEENELNEYINLLDLLGNEYSIEIEGAELTIRSKNSSNTMYLKSNY